MKRGYLLLLAVGCGFQSPAGRPPNGAGVPGMWTFDSAMEFKAAGSAVKDMTIEARGSLTPNAYIYGGLVAHGLQGTRLWANGDTSWTKLDAVTPSGAGLWRGEDLPDNFNLAYLGITNNNAMTIWFEGEVWLEANSSEKFKLTGDDIVFFQIAPPGTAAYGAVSDNSGVEVSVPTPVAGWYPIRIGFGNGGGMSNLDFTHSDAGGPQISWTRERLRARASELSGTLRTVFGRQILGGGQGALPPIAHFEEGDLLPINNFGTALQGAGTDDWSARYFGQVYIEQPGTYTFTIDSNDGCRGRLGTTGHGESHWGRDDGTSSAKATVSASLVAGWNDLAVDYNQVTMSKSLRVRISGPDFANIEVPKAQLRPVEAADDRLASAGDDADYSVPDNGGATDAGTATMAVQGYSGEMVTSIELTYQINSPHWNEIKVDLETPAMPGAPVTIRDKVPTPGGDGDRIIQFTVSPGAAMPLAALLGGPANGTWKLNVYDVVNGGGDSTLKSVKLTLHTMGGPEKVARSASWTSQVLDAQTDVIAIDGITWDERLPAGATLGVFIRACQQADCSDGTWPTTPVAKSAPLTIGPARYLQLRVDMTSDGTLEPELRSLSVMYRRDPRITLVEYLESHDTQIAVT